MASFASFYKHSFPQLLRQIRRIKRRNEPKFYAVAVGRRVGIYRTWPSCKVQIDGLANARYRRFDSHTEALQYLAEEPTQVPIPQQNFSEPLPPGTRSEIVYTDGACWRNGMKDATAGIGVYWPDAPEHNISHNLEGRQTSVRAELQAAITALRQAKELGVQCLTIYTDSHFVIQCATSWLPKWKANGWRASSTGEEVKNRQDLEQLELAIDALDRVIWRAVKSHSGVVGNEEADRLANEAITRLRAKREAEEASPPTAKKVQEKTA